LESTFKTTVWAERSHEFMGAQMLSPGGRGAQQGGRIFCVQDMGAGAIHTFIQCEIHVQHGSCAFCAAWWHSFTQRKAEQTTQPSQQPGILLARKDGNLNLFGPSREIFRLFRLRAKEG